MLRSTFLIFTTLMLSSVALAEPLEIHFQYQNEKISDEIATKVVSIDFSENTTFSFTDTLTLENPETDSVIHTTFSGTVRKTDASSVVAEPSIVYEITYKFGSKNYTALATLPDKPTAKSGEKTVLLSRVTEMSTFYGSGGDKEEQVQESTTVLLSDSGL